MPLSLAVGFAMVSSYVLSSTFVPGDFDVAARKHRHVPGTLHQASALRPERQLTAKLHASRSARAGWWCRPISSWRRLVTLASAEQLGLEIFPEVDAGRFQLRMRAPDGNAHRRDRAAA